MDEHGGTLMMEPMEGSGGASANGPVAKRRRKNDGEPSEPRRLRRSHEACTRCRGKKIKCDSKHPRCTACVTAGVACNQEDRHRQTTISRDHTERLEQIVSQCDALLKRHVQGFSLQTIDDICAKEGIDVSALQPVQNIPPQTSGSSQPTPVMNPAPPPPPPGYYAHPPAGVGFYQYPPYIYPVPPPFQISPLSAPSVQPVATIPGQDPKSNDVSSTHALAKSFGVAPYIVDDTSAAPAPLYHYAPPAAVYNSNDAPLPSSSSSTAVERLAEEDLAVGSSGLDSGRDRVVQLEMPAPRDTAKWRVVSVFRSQNYSSAPSMDIWIPNDRNTLLNIVNVYFVRLNPHRPVFFRQQFLESLNQLYDEGSPRPVFDPGFICSLYLVLALGTLSELNRSGYQGDVANGDSAADLGSDGGHLSPPLRSAKGKRAAKSTPTASDAGVSRLPPDWPAHDEFFYRALAIKPELRVTLSSLQALILLHWYLYAERQGRTLWRLVGSIVRLAIELGLHHDPTTQTMPKPKPPSSSPSTMSENDGTGYEEVHTFTKLDCALRIRLWSIVLVHDRGTSILLGRPLAIAPSDSNTPRPSNQFNDTVFTASAGSNVKQPTINDQISEHFVLSAPIAEIQADIIISLYSPTRQTGESLLRNASRIIKSINLFRHSLPSTYKNYFTGTAGWPISARHALLANLDESTGLTLLKLAISRILLLRALFSSKELGYAERKKALVDAIIQAHNVIAIHTVLVRYPEVGFFTSPIPLQIAAMVILYGRVSECDEGIPGLNDRDGIDREDGRSSAVRILMEDIWLALDMLPRFRWRWETGSGSSGGTNPLIAKLAEEVMESSFSEAGLRGIGAPDESDKRSNGPAERGQHGESRMIAGIGRQGPVGQPVLIPEPEWVEEVTSPNRDKNSSNTPTGTREINWVENATGPSKSQQTTPTLQAAYPPSSYPPSANGPTTVASYTYPPPPISTPSPTHTNSNNYPHPQYTYNPPIFGSQSVNGTNDKQPPKVSSSSSSAPNVPPPPTPTRSNGVQPSTLPTMEVLQSLFYPFYADGVPVHPSSPGSPHASNGSSPPHPPRLARPTNSYGSSVPVPASNGSTNSLLAAVAVQVRAHGGQLGAPDMYMNEERGIQLGHAPPVGGAYVSLTGAYRGHPGGPPPPAPQHPSSQLHHGVANGAYPGHHHPHGSMPPPHTVWPSHGHTSPRPAGYASQPS
ncbi:fungal-specific transcription factor domain-containing protein [Lentinula aff. detonsa]|uniref:Fungal-specific transcription factor domain-containing protein n=1 Tax=Lentinula aff. detonsa TaxID=2804958 RepID=A0AA38NNA7_9AGAR|nr:fungal-specific transcription factor domain-containing protein [Lentinula aff. detonsa]